MYSDSGRHWQRAQRAGEIRFDPGDGVFGAVIVYEQPVPDFQGKHQPDALLTVDAALEMIAHYPAHDIGIVVTAVEATLGKQHFLDQAAPGPSEPAGQRHGESHLAAVDDLLGKVSLGEPFEHDLR